MEPRDLPNLEVRMGLDIMVTLKELQQQKWAFKRELKAANGAPARKEASSTVRNTFLVVTDDDDNADVGQLIVDVRISSQATAFFKAGFENAGVALKVAVADLEGYVSRIAPNTLGLQVVGEGGQPDEMHDFKQALYKENAVLYVACDREKGACARNLLEKCAI